MSSAAPATYLPLLLSSGVHASAARWPNKVALRCEGEQRTYAELAERAQRITGGMITLGLRKGDRVALIAPNCVEYPEVMLGVSDAGGIVATLSPRLTAPEIAAACDDCGARFIIAHPSVLDTIRSANPRTAEKIMTFGPEYERWVKSSERHGVLASLDETDPFTLVYSSGTTGRPKGILISHRSRTLTFHGMAMEYGCYGPDDLQLGIAPMSHGAGFAFIMASLFFGGTVDILARFDPLVVLEKLATQPFTGVFLVPTHFQAIFALDAASLERYKGRFGALRTIMSNAAALPQRMKEKIVAYFGPGLLHETYGSTEAGIVTNLRPQDQLVRKQSVGHPFCVTEVRLLDANGREVGPGEIGELYARSPYLFSGYFNQPQETAAAVRDGWVTAGDLAQRDADGYIYIVDRKKDMVVTGGFNVYPREIEEVLHRHPAVLEAAAFGIPDEKWGEALVACVVVKPHCSVSAEELTSHCRQSLAGYKLPKGIHFIEALPRNPGGKVLKNTLRERVVRDRAA